MQRSFKAFRTPFASIIFIPLVFLIPHFSEAQPTAQFSLNQTQACDQLVLQNITNQSSGNITSYQWDFDNGNSSTKPNPSTAYTSPGTYQITLSVSGPNGTDSTSQTVQIFAPPQPQASAQQDSVCTGESVAFTNQTSVPPQGAPVSQYTWFFGDGSPSSNQQAPSHTYTSKGQFSITLQATDQNGCQASKTVDSIDVGGVPQVDFEADTTKKCLPPLQPQFTNLTTGAANLSYSWTFGNGQTSTAENPSNAVYDTLGQYSVKLKATTPFGCADSLRKNKYIRVLSGRVNISASNPDPCVGDSIQLVASDLAGGATYRWYSIQEDPQNTFPSNPLSGSNLDSIQVAFAKAEALKVVLDIKKGCRYKADTIAIQVRPNPVAQFDYTPKADCQANFPLSVAFTNNSLRADQYQWSFGGAATPSSSTAPNPSNIQFANQGPHSVTLTADSSANQCSDDTTLSIDFTPTLDISESNNPCGTSDTIGFSINTNLDTSIIANYSWDYGDGTVASGPYLKNPTHGYTSLGKKIYTLTVQTSTGCTLTATDSTTVLEKPDIGFEANDTVVCFNDPVTFTATDSTSLNEDSLEYDWNLGLGSGPDTSTFQFTYGEPGQFTVSVTASNEGCEDDTLRNQYIEVLPPKTIIEVDSLVSCDLTVGLKDASIDMDTSSSDYSRTWTFGDGSPTSGAAFPEHTYPDTGLYQVKLRTAFNNPSATCQDTDSVQVRVAPIPRPDFSISPDSGCIPFTAQFDTTSIPDQTTGYSWNFGNGDNSTQIANSITYTRPGRYPVTLSINNQYGCTNEKTVPNGVTAVGAEVDFTVGGQRCLPDTLFFSDASNTGGIAPSNYIWDFDEPGAPLGTGKNVSHIYSQEDTFYVNLTLNFNFSNLTCSYDASQTIEHGLFADFMADTNRCRYDSIAFTNTTPDTNGLHFTWRFGGSADTIRGYEAGWQYPDTGDFAVELVARNADSSCKSTELKPQYISIQEPDAAFSGGPLLSNCPPLNSAFTASNPAGVQSFIWDFGNGPPSTLGSPTAFVNYNLPDTHDVQLIAVDTLGCRDTVTKTDYVKVDGPLGNFNFTGIDNCLPDTVQIHVGFQQGIDEVIIDMGDGGLINKTLTGNTDTLDTTYVYTSAGTYSPQLILQDGNCSVEFDYPLSAPQPSWSPLPNVAYAVDTPVCLGSQAEFNNQTTSPVGGLSYSWSFGDGNTASTSDPLHRYPSTGTYDVRLIATDSKGCKDTLEEQQRVSVVDTPAIQALVDNSPAAATFCREDTFQLGQTWQQQTSAPYNWNWRCLNSPCNIDDASAPATFAIAENSSDYILSVSDAHQCSDSDTVSVTVNPLPAVTTGPDKLICAGEAVQLSASGAQSYNWTPGTLLDDATLAQPSARLDTPVTFVVRGTDANGCQDTAQQTVSVTRIDTIAADTAFCAGGRVQLNVGPEGNAVEWQPAAGLSDPQSYTPLAQPEDSTTYAAIVTYSANCVDTDSVAVGVFPALNTQAGPDTTLCQGSDSLQLTASGGDVFQWTPPTGLSADTGTSVMARPASNTAYQVVARDTSTGCRDTAGAAYRYHPTAPEAAFSLPSFAFVQTPVTLENTTSNASSYSWRFTGATPAQATGEAPPQLTYTEPGDYPIELAVADKNECRDTARKTLQIRKAPSLRVPSVFSPNGDGINEEVHVISSVPLEEYTFRVFTRHGRKVFTTDDFSDGWDGTLPNGSPAPEGVYTYYMKGTNFRGNTIERSGHITLVR